MGRLCAGTAAALLALGCPSGDSDDDSGADLPRVSDDAGGSALEPGSRVLELESDDVLELGFGEDTDIHVRLVDTDGDPVPEARVSFALMGRPQDSSLRALDQMTDADGRVSNQLVAGQTLATFRIRISAAGAEDRYVQAAVSNAGFGSLVVDAAYDGRRLVQKRVVTLLTNMKCEEAMQMIGDPMATLSDLVNEPARFRALPAKVSYTIIATAEGKDETVVASGCVDDLIVEADSELQVSVPYTDAPLMPAGRYTLTADLVSEAPARTLAAAIETAGSAVIVNDSAGVPREVDAEAHFMLDTLITTLRGEDYANSALPGLADAIEAERMIPTLEPMLEPSLTATLGDGGYGPSAALAQLVLLTESTLGAVKLVALLDFGDGTAETLAWHGQRLEATSTTGGPLSVSIADLGPNEDSVQALFEAERDLLMLSSVSFPVAFGSLGSQALNSVASKGPAGYGDQLRGLLGCTQFGSWLATLSLVEVTCDDACVMAICDRAMTRVVGAADGALRQFDEKRPTMTLAGELAMTDEDGDLQVEALSSELLEGSWDGSVDSDGIATEDAASLSGPATGVPVSAAPTGAAP